VGGKKLSHPACHVIVYSVFGPRSGPVVFFSFLGGPPIFFCRASAAASLASLCLSRSESEMLGSFRGGSVSSTSFAVCDVLAGAWVSFAAPSL
jgi:hypothetical protein